MTEIHLNLKNFTDFEEILKILPNEKKYEFTSKKVFRCKKVIMCTCGTEMLHNGYDYARKKGFGKVRIGKQICPNCDKQHHEDKRFWKNLLSQWHETIVSLIYVLKYQDVSWQTISTIMKFILPCGKDKARYLFNRKIEQFEYAQDNYVFVGYDEQHPKKGRMQKFRLALINCETGVPIAEELFDDKSNDTIELFLRRHLDTTKEIVVITDCDRRYPEIFKKIWGNKVIHQKCLMHLNKLVVTDFGKNTSLLNEYNKYMILNIFYNRKKELKFLEKLLKKQDKKTFSSHKEKSLWVKEMKNKFREFVKQLENRRRRLKNNLQQRPLWKATQIFGIIYRQKNLLSEKIQKRLDMIKENWKYFTAFYHIKGCPATNNKTENYFSTSLKTETKKQLRTDEGIINKMKLSAFKRTKGFSKPKKTILEIYGLFRLITT